VRISTLQIGMIIAGVVLVVAVLIYNALQMRAYRRRTATARAASPAATQGVPSRGGGASDRVEPSLRGDTPRAVAGHAAVQAPSEPPAAPFAIPMDVIARGEGTDIEVAESDDADARSLDYAVPSNDVQTPSRAPDPDIECVVTLQSVSPVPAGAIAAGLTARIGKPLRWFGRADSRAPWQPIAKDTQGSFSEFAACLLLADRNGPVSRAQVEAFFRVVGEIARALPGAFDAPDLDDEVNRADALDKLCAELDLQIGLTVQKPDNTSIAGTRLRGVAEAAGFRVAGGRFDLVGEENGPVLYSLQNARNDPLTPDFLRTGSTTGVVFVLDVPRVADPARTFDHMKLAAKRMAVTLSGDLVDDNGRTLDDAALATIRQQVQAAADQLREVHIEPGGERANALFGA
jgi:hypothetical protein